MTTAVLATPPYLAFYDLNGAPLAGGKVYTFAAGTTTPKATFTDQSATVPMANPIVLDSSGRATWWIVGAYKYIVKDALGNTIATTDNVTSFSTLAAVGSSFFESFSGDGSTTGFTLSTDEGTDSKGLMIFVDSGQVSDIANGTFATDTIWTKGAGWTIAAGVATATGAISTAISQTATQTLVAGKSYAVTYTITVSAGTLVPSIGGQNGVIRSAAGTYSDVIVAGSSQAIAFTGAGFTGTLDNVTVTLAAGQGYQILNPNQYTIAGTALTIASAPAAGTNNIFVFAPSSLLGAASSAAALAQTYATAALTSETNAAASAVSTAADAVTTANNVTTTNNNVTTTSANVTTSGTNATNAANSATAAAASATAAAASAAQAAGQLIGTSTTSNAVGTGSKSFATQTGLDLAIGGFIVVAETSSPGNFMHGQVTSYNSGTGAAVFNILDTGGSGTYTDWTISVSGPAGTGNVSTTGSPTAGNLAKFSASNTVTNTDLTGDVTTSGTAATTIANNAVTTAKINNGAVTEAKITLVDNTTNNVSTSAHGFAPKAPNDATKYLDGTGAYSVPGGGELILLATKTASNSTALTFTSVITSSYDCYKFIFKLTPASGSNLQVRTSSNNSTFDTSGYDWGNYGWDIFGGVVIGAGTHADSQLILNSGRTIGSTATNGVSGYLELYYPNGTDNYKGMSWFASNNNNSSGPAVNNGGGQRTSNSIVNAIEFYMSTGNITSGTIECYGIKNT